MIICPGSWCDNNQKTNKTKQKHWFDISSRKDAFLEDGFQMTAIALVSVINHYHINGLHLCWDTLYQFVASILRHSVSMGWNLFTECNKKRKRNLPTVKMESREIVKGKFVPQDFVLIHIILLIIQCGFI